MFAVFFVCGSTAQTLSRIRERPFGPRLSLPLGICVIPPRHRADKGGPPTGQRKTDECPRGHLFWTKLGPNLGEVWGEARTRRVSSLVRPWPTCQREWPLRLPRWVLLKWGPMASAVPIHFSVHSRLAASRSQTLAKPP